MILRFVALLSLTILTACNPYAYRLRVVAPAQIPLFIAMPINENAAEPIGQIMYDKLISHFQQRGYALVAQPVQGYVLKTTIRSLKTIQQFISQDVILLHKLIELNAECSLYNFGNELIKEKNFIFETIISKAAAPLQQDAYTTYALGDMLERHLQIIEQTFRPYLQ